MSEVPVFYATTDGQTRRIAEALAAALRDLGLDSEPINVATSAAADYRWDRARAVVVAASLHAGTHQRTAEAFVRRSLVELNARPSLFISVSLSICSATPTEVEAARKIAQQFPDHLGWKATRVACVGGRLAYTQYGFLTRYVMRRIAAKSGGPTDTSRDHELTDWTQVRGLARELAAQLAARTQLASQSRAPVPA
jgi:menaquinone-dependent protoporphyrinogen oxidase